MDKYTELMIEFYNELPIDNEEGFEECWMIDSDRMLAAALEDEPELWEDHAWSLRLECLPRLCAALNAPPNDDEKPYHFERFGWNVADILKGILKDYLEERWVDNEDTVRQSLAEEE